MAKFLEDKIRRAAAGYRNALEFCGDNRHSYDTGIHLLQYYVFNSNNDYLNLINNPLGVFNLPYRLDQVFERERHCTGLFLDCIKHADLLNLVAQDGEHNTQA